jgi:hypothetical protein
MNYYQDEFHKTELLIPEIKTYLHGSIGRLLEDSGFVFKKTDFTYKKKLKKNFAEFSFLIYNYYPVNYNVKFTLNIFNNDIQAIKQKIKFDEFVLPTNWSSIYLSMGEFIAGLMKEEIKWRSNFSYRLVTPNDLIDAAVKMSDLLKTELVALSNALLTVEGISDFYRKKGIKWTVSTLNINNILSDLISAKLGGMRDTNVVFRELSDEMKSVIKKEKLPVHDLNALVSTYEYLNNSLL